jgi:ABC-type transport system substrate-binding protein
MSRRRFIGGTTASAAALVGGAPLHPVRALQTPASGAGPSIVIGTLGEAASINPFLTSESEGDWRCKMLFDEFVRANVATFAPEPGLAAEWSRNELTFTFKLQPNARFADGAEVTADDVAFTLKGFLAKETNSPRQVKFLTIAGAQEFIDGSAEDVSGIKVVDPKTIDITLSHADAAFLYNLRYLFIVPKAPLDGKQLTDDPWFTKPVGAGPFVFESWAADADFVATKNPHYWQTGKPALTGFTHRKVADAKSLMTALEGGNIDGTNYVDVEFKTRIDVNGTLILVVPPFKSPNGWMFNCSHEWLSKKEVRRAIAMALDTKQFASSELIGLGEAGIGPIAPGSWAYDGDLQPLPYEVDTAKELITASGMPEGTEIRFLINRENPFRRAWLEFTEQNLLAIGIRVMAEELDYPAVVERVTTTKDYDACGVDFAGVTAEPSRLHNQFRTGSAGNFMNYSNEELDILLEQARQEMDLDKAKVIYKQIQAILVDDSPMFFAWYRPVLHVVTSAYENYVPSAAYGLFHTLEDWIATG